EWQQLEAGFRAAFKVPIGDSPRRTQNRNNESSTQAKPEMALDQFRNEPDTDWALVQNSAWAAGIVARTDPTTREIPLVIGGAEITGECASECRDPSRPGVVVARYQQATVAEIDQAI